MKKHLLYALLFCLTVLPFSTAKADTVVDGQSTEGKDFWVTFMQADQDPNNELVLSLSISSRENCQVTISNPFTDYSETLAIVADEMKLVELYSGNVLTYNARSEMETSGKVCYAVNSEQIDTCALHVTATKNISLFATNYKRATFDATNILPTASLLDEYMIQTYTPSDHGGVSKTQGSHFAIIAAEDDVEVDITPTVPTYGGRAAGETFSTGKLKKGQVYYVWTGKEDGAIGDLSGSSVKARDGKKIAVFQGCPHTNIPYQKKERDHIFSQAMPIRYWGNTFVLTGSKDRKVDYVRILALNDGTEVRINGNLVHTFDFSVDTKQYWEFTIGANGTYGKSGSCIVSTSCPCAAHLFLASKTADGVDNGDPAMLWVNPIEQQIDQITFATYESVNGTTHNYVNVVTKDADKMYLDGTPIDDQFKLVDGSNTSTFYFYAQIDLGTEAKSHTLKSQGGNFIAHVYGFTKNESYGYSAGGATKPLTQFITINGEIFSPDKENTLCGEDTIKFACHPDYEWTKIIWNFGDGQSKEITEEKDSVVEHYYALGGVYDAYVLIYRESSHVCAGQNAVDSIPVKVTIGRYQFEITSIDIPCPVDGAPLYGKVFYRNESRVNLKGDNVTIEFDDNAKADGFKDDELVVTESYFQITIPNTAKPKTLYGIHIEIKSDCGGTDTIMNFQLNYDKDVIDQRYDNVLGLLASTFEGQSLSDFQWYRTSDSTAIDGQISANLNFYDLPYGGDINDSYYVCFIINKGQKDEVMTCACAKSFNTNAQTPNFENDSSLIITATYTVTGDKVFVNADWNGKTDIDCYAQWITTSGHIYQDWKFDIPDGGCTIPTPQENGLYLLRIKTGKKNRSFKFLINH